MHFLILVKTHWFDLLQSAAIVSGFVYTALGFSLDSRSRRAEFVSRTHKAYRAIWTNLLRDPSLARILDPEVDLQSNPITPVEARFTLLLLMHLSSVHYAMEQGLQPSWPGLEQDIRQFFSLPIPAQILKRYLPLQPPNFRRFLERVLQSQDRSR